MDRRRIIPARAGFTPSGTPRPPGRTDHPRSRGVYASGLGAGIIALRIIPARAGFTPGAAGPRRPRPDHPRSRGVYGSRFATPPSPPGSSPLARGLPLSPTPTTRRNWIIPARAGFTSSGTPRARSSADHPRSRGVYPAPAPTSSTRPGSSPLARGLQSGSLGGGDGPGIIPARAGFTPPSHDDGDDHGDHPRSRGVYLPTGDERDDAGGSSPLARGLRRDMDEIVRPVRIIPARAGFTPCIWRPSGAAGDHPRSRGVYLVVPARCGGSRGSSPLARGLHLDMGVQGVSVGIIPARAGFTTAPGCPSRPARDHPRSRGVYLFHTPDPPSRVWIIPARAGFTQPSHDGPETGPDHPRSRGVYPRRLRGGAPGPGSSPLARGLRGGPVQSVRARGIIPARAGFTGVDVECEAAGEDHPRSRGVYTTIVVDLADERIIPARAGFTRPPLSTSSPRSDHPRSRGVYSGAPPLVRG